MSARAWCRSSIEDPFMNGRRALAVATAISALPGIYAAVRCFQHWLQPEPDPAAIVWAEHSDLLSRCMVTGFVGATALVAALALAKSVPAKFPGILAGTATVSALAVLVQAWFVP